MFRKFLALALVCLCAILSSHGAEEFELAGEITFKRFQNNKQQHQVDSRFTLQKRGREWLVNTVTEKSASNWVAIAIGSDGSSNMFEVCSNFTSMASVATVLPGFIPIGCTDITVPYLWLAYASHDYLATVTNHLVSPFYHLSQQNTLNPIFLLPAVWQTNSLPPYGLKTLHIFNDGFMRTVKESKFVLIPYPTPYQAGFTNATYQVDKWETIGGMLLPTAFWFEQYNPSWVRPQSSNGLALYTRVDGRVNSMRAGASSATMRPGLQAATPIVDFRFDPKTPTTTAGKSDLRTYQQPRQYPAYQARADNAWLSEKQAAARIQGDDRPVRWKWRMLYTAAGFLFITGLLLLVRRARHKAAKTQ